MARKLVALGLAVVGSLTALATNTWYVAKNDPNAADTPDQGRGGEALPFKTIQAALDNAAFEAGDIVLVKPGDYSEGKYAFTDLPVTNVVYIAKTAILRSTEGSAVTRIVGKRKGFVNQYCKDGCRCVYVSSAARGTVIEGFTLKDGMACYSDKGGGYYNYECCFGGGVFVKNSYKDVYVVDCKFDSCRAGIGAAMSGGTAIRCTMENSDSVYSTAAIFKSAYAFACAVKGTTYQTNAKPYVMDSGSTIVNCTIVNNNCRGITNGVGVAYNCLVAANATPNTYDGSLANGCYAANANVDTFTTLGYAGDYRLRHGSGAIGIGLPAKRSVLIDLGVPANYLEKDLSGSVIDWTAATMNAGAEQSVGTATTVTVTDPDGELLCDAAGKTVVVGDLQPWEITIRANTETNRYPKGFTVNGVEHLFSSYPGSETVVVQAADSDSQTVVIRPMASDWYVNANGGDDAKSGFTRETAKLTLTDVVTNTALRSGDTIIALPGTYKTGKMRPSSSSQIYTRVSVPSGVTLKASGTPEETVILGERSPTPDDSTYGTGPDAVRCVNLAANATVAGFTLTGGRTIKTNTNNADSEGGALYVDNSSVIRDCIVSNNYAYTGSAGWLGNYINCQLFANRAFSNAGAVLYSPSVVEGCSAERNVCNNVLMYHGHVNNCTIGYNENGFSVYNSHGSVSNSIIYRVSANSAIFYHCLVYTNTSRKTEISAANLAAHDSVGLASWAAAGLESDFRPRKDSVAVDRGDASSRGAYFPATDADGVPRVLNGQVDIGAFEYDWRKDYGTLLGRGVTVTDVSENVVALADGVRVPEGVLVVNWTLPNTPSRKMAVEVTGEGVLSVQTNGVAFATVTAAQGRQQLLLKSVPESVEIGFTFEGDGSAKLSGFESGSGLVLVFR